MRLSSVDRRQHALGDAMSTQRCIGRSRSRLPAQIALVCLALVGPTAQGEVTFDWATVGNPGNAADTLTMSKGPGLGGASPDYTSGYGAVGYTYSIAKHNVTNAQYVEFLNKVDPSGTSTTLFITNMTNAGSLGAAGTGGIDRNPGAASGSKYSVKSGQGHFPVVHINWARAARFVNWLANGQGSGGTETGVYDVSGILANGFATPPSRAVNAQFFLPSENEWYKAAYYDPTLNSGTGGYWQYGTRSNTAPSSAGPPGSANAANIGAGTDGQSGGTLAATAATTGASFNTSTIYLTNVGAYTSAQSAYGLYDLDGLVYNWTEATRENPSFAGQMLPIFRGGSWRYNEGAAGAAYRNTQNGAGVNTGQYQFWGFRVATVAAVPEPSACAIACAGILCSSWLAYRRRSIS
jgi:formylglycine-generating enzyme required for sulfatase activity